MKRRHFCILLLISIVTIICIDDTPIFAQERVQLNRASQYHLGASDELLIPVNIWGFVLKPGQYMVPNKTDLITLLSFAGGPKEGAKISKIHIVRSDPNARRNVFKVDIKRYLETADAKLIPILKPGDTIVVKGTTFNWIQRVLTFISNIAVFATIWYYIARANEL